MTATTEPERDRAVSLHVSLPGSLAAQLRALAEREDRTVSRECARAVAAHIERQRTGEARP
jgi:predicted transcriptional regulator